MQDKRLVPKLPNEYREEFEKELRKKLMEALKAIEAATRDS